MVTVAAVSGQAALSFARDQARMAARAKEHRRVGVNNSGIYFPRIMADHESVIAHLGGC